MPMPEKPGARQSLLHIHFALPNAANCRFPFPVVSGRGKTGHKCCSCRQRHGATYSVAVNITEIWNAIWSVGVNFDKAVDVNRLTRSILHLNNCISLCVAEK